MVLHVLIVWGTLGHALEDYGSVILLARQLQEAAELRNLGCDLALPFVVLMEGKKFQDF